MSNNGSKTNQQALQYYMTELHSAAFVLPAFAKKAIMM